MNGKFGNAVLAHVRLTAEEVRKLTGQPEKPKAVAPEVVSETAALKYLEAEEQRRAAIRLSGSYKLMPAFRVMGYPAWVIAGLFDVSDECVWKRLRVAGMTPKKKGPPFATMLAYLPVRYTKVITSPPLPANR